MRACIAYDCLYPWTKGGAERWYRHLAGEAVVAGHDVTYLTRLQWERNQPPSIVGVRVVAVGGSGALYGADGARRLLPPLRYGLGVFWHLLRNRRSYDVIHLASFPFFSLLGAWAALLGTGTPIHVDWHEVWSDAYWREYAGPVAGRVGALIQRLCVRVAGPSYAFSPRHAALLPELGRREPTTMLPGLLDEDPAQGEAADAGSAAAMLFVGRLIPEKRAPLAALAMAEAAAADPSLSGLLIGEGPELDLLRAAIAGSDRVRRAGFVETAEVRSAMAGAACLVVCSTREGWGMVVVEAMSVGTPVVIVDEPGCGAVAHVVTGVNGVVVPNAEPATIAAAIATVVASGPALRASTAAWFEDHRASLRIEASSAIVLGAWSA